MPFNSSAFGFLLRATPTFKVAFSEVGVAFALFTLSSMTNQQGDWSWAELLLVNLLIKENKFRWVENIEKMVTIQP